MISSVADPVKYYRPDILVHELSVAPTEKKITVVPYVTQVHGLNYSENLQNKTTN